MPTSPNVILYSRMRTARSSSRPGGSPPGTPPGTRHPSVDRQTPVNILPCPKLRLRPVNIAIKITIKSVSVDGRHQHSFYQVWHLRILIYDKFLILKVNMSIKTFV